MHKFYLSRFNYCIDSNFKEERAQVSYNVGARVHWTKNLYPAFVNGLILYSAKMKERGRKGEEKGKRERGTEEICRVAFANSHAAFGFGYVAAARTDY